MIGAIIGDVVGSRFERHNHKSKDFQLFDAKCHPTDDSVMSLAVAKAILASQDDINILPENATICMQELGRIYKNAGYGRSFYGWINANDPKPYDSYGNGSAMRVSPCGYAANSIEEAKELSAAVTKVSHDHPEGMKGAEAIAVAVYLAKTGSSKDEIKQYIVDNYYEIGFTIDEIRETYRFDVSCQGSVPVALEAFFESEDFEDAVRIAVSVGGDSDTIAAMAGSVAEAYYGVPEEIIDNVMDYLDGREMEILYYFEKSFPSRLQCGEGEELTVFDYLDEAVDKILPAGTEIEVDGEFADGAFHGWVDDDDMIPDFSSFGDKADVRPDRIKPVGRTVDYKDRYSKEKSADKKSSHKLIERKQIKRISERDNTGVEIYSVGLDEEELKRQGYKAAANKYLPEIAMFTRALSEQLSQKAASTEAEKVLDGAYKVVIKEGMHLGKSSSNKDALRGLLFSDEGNKLSGQADLLKIDGKEVFRSPQIISGVFSMMSFVTGQYYMSVINKKLESIGRGINAIQGFLKTDKASMVKADSIALYRICRDLEYLMNNPCEKQSVLTELKSIRKNAVANIEFFDSMTDSVRKSFYEGSKLEKLKYVFKEFEDYYPQYWCSVFNYVLAETLNTIVAEMDSQEYISNRIDDVEAAIIRYKESFKKSVDKLDRYIRHARVLNKKKVVPKELKFIADALPAAGFPLIAVKAAVGVASGIDSMITKDAKHQKKKASHREEKFIKACSNIEPLVAIGQMLDDYRVAQNSGIEMIVTEDNAYIRYIDVEE